MFISFPDIVVSIFSENLLSFLLLSFSIPPFLLDKSKKTVQALSGCKVLGQSDKDNRYNHNTESCIESNSDIYSLDFYQYLITQATGFDHGSNNGH